MARVSSVVPVQGGLSRPPPVPPPPPHLVHQRLLPPLRHHAGQDLPRSLFHLRPLLRMLYDVYIMQDLTRDLLIKIGENPDREGLANTPQRVEKRIRFLPSACRPDPR